MVDFAEPFLPLQNNPALEPLYHLDARGDETVVATWTFLGEATRNHRERLPKQLTNFRQKSTYCLG